MSLGSGLGRPEKTVDLLGNNLENIYIQIKEVETSNNFTGFFDDLVCVRVLGDVVLFLVVSMPKDVKVFFCFEGHVTINY